MPPRKILIVNDWTDSFKLWTLILQRGGFAVACVQDGQAALNFLAERPDDLPDLILMDTLMPGMGGEECIQRIKAERRWRRIPLAVMAPFLGVNAVVEYLDLGVQDWIALPTMPQELVERVRALLPQLHMLM